MFGIKETEVETWKGGFKIVLLVSLTSGSLLWSEVKFFKCFFLFFDFSFNFFLFSYIVEINKVSLGFSFFDLEKLCG